MTAPAVAQNPLITSPLTSVLFSRLGAVRWDPLSLMATINAAIKRVFFRNGPPIRTGAETVLENSAPAPCATVEEAGWVPEPA